MVELVGELTASVFGEEVPAGKLPDRGIDHLNSLQPGAEPPFGPMIWPG